VYRDLYNFVDVRRGDERYQQDKTNATPQPFGHHIEDERFTELLYVSIGS